MANIKYVRQRPTKFAQYYDVNNQQPNRNVHIKSRQTFGLRTETDMKTWVTGMNENAATIRKIQNPKLQEKARKEARELRERFEKHFGEDLSPLSKYWETYRIKLVEPDKEEIMLDLDKPEEAMQYYVAIANFRLAPSEEDLDEPNFENAFLYIYDPKAHTSRRARLQELKDEVGYLIHTHRNNIDRLFYWVSALGMLPNIHMSREELYHKINSYRETRKSIEDYESFQAVLSKSAEELQAMYLFKIAKQKKRITKLNGQYVLQEVELGRFETDAIETLTDPEHEQLLDSLMDLSPKL